MAVEFLLKRYPEFVDVDSLPLETVQERVCYFEYLATSVTASIFMFVASSY